MPTRGVWGHPPPPRKFLNLRLLPMQSGTRLLFNTCHKTIITNSISRFLAGGGFQGSPSPLCLKPCHALTKLHTKVINWILAFECLWTLPYLKLPQLLPCVICIIIHCCFIWSLAIWNNSQYSTVEHDFYKLTTTIKLLRSNHSQASIRRHAKCWVEWKEEFALQRVALLLARSIESIPNATSLFEHHLNIDSLSLFKNEGASCAGQTFAHKNAASLTSNHSPMFYSLAVSLVWNACRR